MKGYRNKSFHLRTRLKVSQSGELQFPQNPDVTGIENLECTFLNLTDNEFAGKRFLTLDLHSTDIYDDMPRHVSVRHLVWLSCVFGFIIMLLWRSYTDLQEFLNLRAVNDKTRTMSSFLNHAHCSMVLDSKHTTILNWKCVILLRPVEVFWYSRQILFCLRRHFSLLRKKASLRLSLVVDSFENV